MVTEDKKRVHTRTTQKGHSDPDLHEHVGTEETCRCKEASKMSPRELLSLMMSDLAFWKKDHKA